MNKLKTVMLNFLLLALPALAWAAEPGEKVADFAQKFTKRTLKVFINTADDYQ